MSPAQQQPTVDMEKLNAFIGRFVADLGASAHAGMVVIGEKLGLYKSLAARPMTSKELASDTHTDERYVREWLASQAAGGYITYDEKSGKFSLNREQAFTLANEESPAYLPGACELALGSLAAVPRIAESFRTGAGMKNGLHSGWAVITAESEEDARLLVPPLLRQEARVVRVARFDTTLARVEKKEPSLASPVILRLYQAFPCWF